MTITGVKGTGTALIFAFGNTISLTSYDETQYLENKPFSCMTLAVSSSEMGTTLDQLNTLLVFNYPGVGATPTPASGSTTPTTHAAPSISVFSRTVKVKLPKGTGTVTASCGLPSTETCTFSLTLYATVKNGHATSRVKVGTVTGKITGGKTGKLTLRLNAAGRRYLKHGSFHVEAKGTARSTAGLVTRFHRRLTIKKTK